MFELLSISGPFGILSTLLGGAAAAMQLAAVVRPARERMSRAAAAIALAALLVGIAGTGVGLMVCSDAILQASPGLRADLWMRGRAVAGTSTSVGALWASLNALLFAAASGRRR